MAARLIKGLHTSNLVVWKINTFNAYICFCYAHFKSETDKSGFKVSLSPELGCQTIYVTVRMRKQWLWFIFILF